MTSLLWWLIPVLTALRQNLKLKTRLNYIVSSELAMDSEPLSEEKKNREGFSKENSRCVNRRHNIGSRLRGHDLVKVDSKLVAKSWGKERIFRQTLTCYSPTKAVFIQQLLHSECGVWIVSQVSFM